MTNLIKPLLISGALSLGLAMCMASPAFADAEHYAVEPSHSYVAYEISHIGFGTELGVFSDLTGEFTYYPEDPSKNSGTFTVSMSSLHTFHAERNEHVSSDDFFGIDKHPVATFTSTSYEKTGEKTALLHGKMTIKGVTKPVTLTVTEMAAKKDPWGNYRRAFSATGKIRLKDFGIDFDLGPASEAAKITVNIEAVREEE